MIELSLSPIILSIGQFQIRYYGLIYILGFILGLFVLFKAKRKGKINLTSDQIYNIIFYTIIGDLIGARLFHVLFWNFNYYLERPIEILYLWQGGLSFHGGLIGIFIALFLYTKKHNINLMKIADIITIPAIFILALGRVANFINQEILGTITQLPWCVKFLNSVDPFNCRHPVQLYAATGRFATFFILLGFPKPKKDGFIFLSFLVLISIGRLSLDFLREDLRFLGLSSGQWLSALVLIVGGYALLRYYKEDLKILFRLSKKESATDQ